MSKRLIGYLFIFRGVQESLTKVSSWRILGSFHGKLITNQHLFLLDMDLVYFILIPMQKWMASWKICSTSRFLVTTIGRLIEKTRGAYLSLNSPRNLLWDHFLFIILFSLFLLVNGGFLLLFLSHGSCLFLWSRDQWKEKQESHPQEKGK